MVIEVQDTISDRSVNSRVQVVVARSFRWAENEVRNTDEVVPFAYANEDGAIIVQTFPTPATRWQALERSEFYGELVQKAGGNIRGDMIAGRKLGEVTLVDAALETNMLRHLQNEFYGLVYRFPISSRIGEPLELSCSRGDMNREVWYLGGRTNG